MKLLLKLFMFSLCFFPFAVNARLTETQKANCEKLLQIAESKDADWIYDECGFGEEDTAWYDWAPILSQKKYAKGLYQLCKRYPEHEYNELYCKKAADAGSVRALYTLAQNAKMAGDDELYEKNLLEIITRNPIQNKIKISGFDDIATRQAYEDLAKYYYELQDEVKTQIVVPYLQIAAEKGSLTAASTLAIFLYQMTNSDQKAMYEKYLWEAIMGGCPAAEEVLGLINYGEEDRITSTNQRRSMDRLLFTCESSKANNKPQQNLKKVQDCACNEVLSWNKVQGDKPFLILALSSNSALLQDKAGMQYTVEVGEKVEGGYVVEEIRQTAVILRKTAQRIILLYREDADCIELCKNSDKPQKLKGDIPPYELNFTPEECAKIADNIENLDNPLEPFRGASECLIQDWKKWGEKALKEQKDKHLFLMANYEKSHYIPAYVSRAKLMFAQAGERAFPKIKQTLQGALSEMPRDTLSLDNQEYAFCLQGALYFNSTPEDKKMGFSIAELGAQRGYPYSMNMLGVAYANGWGTAVDTEKAKEWFLSAETAIKVPFADARRNYILLQSNSNFDKMEYKNCEQIINPSKLSKEELLELYK